VTSRPPASSTIGRRLRLVLLLLVTQAVAATLLPASTPVVPRPVSVDPAVAVGPPPRGYLAPVRSGLPPSVRASVFGMALERRASPTLAERFAYRNSVPAEPLRPSMTIRDLRGREFKLGLSLRNDLLNSYVDAASAQAAERAFRSDVWADSVAGAVPSISLPPAYPSFTSTRFNQLGRSITARGPPSPDLISGLLFY
jgi:hypothetical protein